MSRVLVVEDDASIARTLSVTLRARGYEVETVRSAAEAAAASGRWHPEVILLDLGLPDEDGLTVIRGLRAWSSAPIIVVSARQDSAGKVEALDLGADDYVTKPFGMDELLARLRAALRRSDGAAQAEPVIQTGDGWLSIDLAASRVAVDGQTVRLTPLEWRLVEHLARNAGRLVSQKELLQHVWGPSYEQEKNYLRVYLSQLRQKLERDSSHPRHFITETGMGYRFVL